MFRALEWVSAKAMTIAGWCYLVITLLICFDIAARRLLGGLDPGLAGLD